MKKLLEKIKEWLMELPLDKRVLFVAGILISAFASIVLKMEVCIVPSIAIGFIISFISNWKSAPDWWKMAAVVIGGAIIQLFQILA